MINPDQPLILASASRYRAELLSRLRIPFTASASHIDETPEPGETVAALVRRLARAKAQLLASEHPGRWVLGSDQAAAVDESRILGKPGSPEAAIEQLLSVSGRQIRFLTAVALWDGQDWHEATDITTVRFRTLSRSEIERYVETEPALDCAGSFKCEGYGISLFESLDCSDPTGLIGLPLIAVRRLLGAAGYALP